MNRDLGAVRSRLPWALLALIVAMIAGVTLYRQFQSAPARVDSAVPAPNPDGGKAVFGRMSPEQLRGLALRSPGQSAPMTVEDMAGVMEKRKRMVEATQAINRERNAAMAIRFASEKVDPAWSGVHEQDLASLQGSNPMQDAGVKAANFQAECRSTMCRIQADFPSRSMANDWLQLYMGSVGDRLPMATAHQATNPDGSVRIEIYGVGRKH